MHLRVSVNLWSFAAIILVGVGAAVGVFAAERPAPLTRAIDIRSLATEDAAKGLPVRLTGTVTFIGTPGSVFVQDETAGTFFRPANREPVQPGDVVEITGRTHVGYYLPGIGVSRFRVIGRGPLPPAVSAGYDDLISGHFHYQHVAIEGIARSQSRFEGGRGLLRVAMGNRIVEVRVEGGQEPERTFVDSRVRVEGLAAGSINSRRQLVQPFLRVVDWTAIVVQEPGVPDDLVPAVSPTELLTFRVAGQGNRRVRIGGIVTAFASPEVVFVRNGETAFGIRFNQPTPVEVGERIEVLGFPQLERFSASVVDARLATRSTGTPPAPVERSIAQLLDGVHDCNLVAVTARVTDSFRIGGDLVLTLQDDRRAAQARVPGATVEVAAGSLIRVVGICQVETSIESGYNARPETVSLRVRSPGDVTVLKLPPWWTVRRLFAILAVLAAVVLLGGLWIFLLRRQVTRQTTALRQRIESEAALRERHRIAREFHDTLEQELTGLGLRLDAAARRTADDKGRNLINVSRSLVSRIQIETRNLIADLRSSAEEAGDLAGVLQTLVDRAAERARPTVRLRVDTALPRLPAATVHHLRMIAAECLTNALKHADASAIEIGLDVTDECLRLTVADNGGGFVSASQTQGKPGHFGCIGIRERCRRLGAEVTWMSRPGAGVTVTIELRLNATAVPREGAPLAI